MSQTIIEIQSLSKKSSSLNRKRVQTLLPTPFRKFTCEKISSLYQLEGGSSPEEITRIAEELLCDPVSEQFFINTVPSDSKTFFIDVWYKLGVTDVVGESVLRAVLDLKIDSVTKAFFGTRYRLVLKKETKRYDWNNTHEKVLIDFATKQLLNPLVQECKILKP